MRAPRDASLPLLVFALFIGGIYPIAFYEGPGELNHVEELCTRSEFYCSPLKACAGIYDYCKSDSINEMPCFTHIPSHQYFTCYGVACYDDDHTKCDESSMCLENGGPVTCFCQDKYQELNASNACIEIDKCSEKHRFRFCAQRCEENRGSEPTCKCDSGFQQQPFSTQMRETFTDCIPDPTLPPPFLVITHNAGFTGSPELLNFQTSMVNASLVMLDTPIISRTFTVHQATGGIHEVQAVTWSYSENAPVVSTFSSQGQIRPGKQVKPLFDISVEVSEMRDRINSKMDLREVDFAMDVRTQNMYFVDRLRNEVFVCSANGSACLTIINTIQHPDHITIDSWNKFLFVTGRPSARSYILYRMKLDGTKSLEFELPSEARCLTVEPITQYAYFYSATSHMIYKLNYKAKSEAHKFYTIPISTNDVLNTEITSMTIFGQYLYYAIHTIDPPKFKSLARIPLNPQFYPNTGTPVFVNYTSDSDIQPLHALQFVHQSNDPDGTGSTKPCAHLLIDGECHCMDGYTKVAEINCTFVNITKTSLLLYTSLSTQLIKAVLINDTICPDLSRSVIVPIRTHSLGDITSWTYDTLSSMLYFSTDKRIYRRGLWDINPYPQLVEGISAASVARIVQLDIHVPSRQLFWSEQNGFRTSISVMSLNTQQHYSYEIINSFEYIFAFAVDEISNRIFTLGSLEVHMYQFSISKHWTNGDDSEQVFEIPGKSGTYFNLVLFIYNQSLYFINGDKFSMASLTELNDTNFRDLLDLDTDFFYQIDFIDNETLILLRSSNGDQHLQILTPGRNDSLTCDRHDESDSVRLMKVIHPLTSAPIETPECQSCNGTCLYNGEKSICNTTAQVCSGIQCTVEGSPATCLRFAQHCDGVIDCEESGEDEDSCTEIRPQPAILPCHPYLQYTCTTPQRCVNLTQMCDGLPDCPTGDDEDCRNCFATSLNTNSALTYFQCEWSDSKSNKCVKNSLVCDGIRDCSDGTDESDCRSCSPSAFLCSSSSPTSCIPGIYECDSHRDCPNGEDEANCVVDNYLPPNVTTCDTSEFLCANGNCIPDFWTCDREDDCGDNSDEADDKCRSETCQKYQYPCAGKGECIPAPWVCDGHADCPQFDDEGNCSYTCRQSEFACPPSTPPTGPTCIPIEKVCDKQLDCTSGGDESMEGCATAKLACNRRFCGGDCHPLPDGTTRCVCPFFTHYSEETGSCHILPMCSQWGVCSQLCETQNSALPKCKCLEGYTLGPDLFTCVPDGGPGMILFANRHSLLLTSTEPSSQFQPIVSGRSIISVDFHYAKQYFFWTDVIADKVYRGTRSSHNNDVLPELLINKREIVSVGLPTAEGIAIDWINDHIFWIDSGLDMIEAADLDGNNRTTIISRSQQNSMDNPRSLAVDPRYGLLFWADWGISEIRSATMAGTDQKKVFRVDDESIIPNGGWANGITLDYDTKRIYWVDAKSDTIQAVRYDGSDFQSILSGYRSEMLLRHPFAITLFGNHIYWSDWRTNSIARANKWNGSDAETVHNIRSQPFDLKVFHPARQPPLSRSVVGEPDTIFRDVCAVNNAGCSHLCMRIGPATHRCICPHLFELKADSETCQVLSEFLVLSSKNIWSLDIKNQTAHAVMPVYTQPVVDLAYIVDHYINTSNVSQSFIFWADSNLRLISSSNLFGGKPSIVADIDSGTTPGMAVDRLNELLYLGSYSLRGHKTGRIDVARLDGTYRTTIVDGLEAVTLIALAPRSSEMFVYDKGTQPPRLYHMYMNGTFRYGSPERSDLLTISGIRSIYTQGFCLCLLENSTGYALYFGHDELIYRYDSSTNFTKQITNGRNASLGRWTIRAGHGVQPDRIYLAVKPSQGLVVNVSYADIINEQISPPRVLKQIKSANQNIFDMKIFHQDDYTGVAACPQTKLNATFIPNSPQDEVKCSYRCINGYYDLPSGECSALNPLLLYSTMTPSAGIFALSLDARTLSTLPTTTETGLPPSLPRGLPDIPQVHKPVSLAFYSDSSNNGHDEWVYWIENSMSIVKVKRDLTMRQSVITGLAHAVDLAIDPFSGNIYWLDDSQNKIEVIRNDGTNRYPLHDTHQKAKAIALFIDLGFIFYVVDDDTGSEVLRYQRGMNHSSTIYTAKGGRTVASISIDQLGKRFYACLEDDNIISMDFNGDNMRVERENTSCSAIAVHNGILYYSTTAYVKSIFKVDLTSSDNETVSIKGEVVGSMTKLLVADNHLLSKLPPSELMNPCRVANGGCESLCLYSGSKHQSSYCVCSTGILQPDGKTCFAGNDFLVFSKVNGLQFTYTHPADISRSNKPYEDIVAPNQNIIAVTVDPDTRKIFYSDIDRYEIYSVDYEGTNQQTIMTGVRGVEGLAYSEHLLYYTSLSQLGQADHAGQPSINKIDLRNTNFTSEIVVGLNKEDLPRAIAVHSCYKYIFWTNWNGKHPSIQRSLMSGIRVVNLITRDIKLPNSITIDYASDQFYWADASLDKLERCDIDAITCEILATDMSPHVFGLAVHGDYIYWSDWMHRSVRMRSISQLDNTVRSLVTSLPRQPMGIAVSSSVTCHDSPCRQALRDGTCEQLCVVIDKEANCKCFDGYHKNEDKCVLNTGCNSDYACGGECIPWELTCDGVPHCKTNSSNNYPADEDPLFCQTRNCPSSYFQCLFSRRCVLAVTKRCNLIDDCGDFSDELNCTFPCTANNTNVFHCATGNECLKNSELCDGIPHCTDKSDELPPHCNSTSQVTIDCSSFEHPFYGSHTNGLQCQNTPECIAPEWICDGHSDCWDDWDETNCPLPSICGVGEQECPPRDPALNGGPPRCIAQSWFCDGEPDCPFGTDESKCSHHECSPGFFRCGDGRCLLIEWRCDGQTDCDTDELNCTSTSQKTCTPHEFRCDGLTRCVPMNRVCDGVADCMDGSDEAEKLPDGSSNDSGSTSCSVRACSSTEFRCFNNRCINSAFVCDRFNDCLDGSDEPETCTYADCDQRTEFSCKTGGRCVPLTAQCDGLPDCPDGSDENAAACPPAPPSECPTNLWKCPGGPCIRESRLCDGTNDCGKFEDERMCGINECLEMRGGCNHQCVDDPIGHHCTCDQGHRLGPDNRTCVDIDECLLPTNLCSQHCTNLPWSYECFCAPGFRLENDKLKCKAIDDSPYILVSNRYYIRNVSLSATVTQADAALPIIKSLTNAIGLDYDWREQIVYWSDVTNSVHSISRMYFNGSNQTVLHSALTRHPQGLAVDWIGRNLYWCDSVMNSIHVSRLDGSNTKLLLSNITEPRTIQVYPGRGYLFYTDWSRAAHVGRVGMDGSMPLRVVNSTGWPNALVIDVLADRFYYGDAKLDYIAVADLDGGHHQVLVKAGVEHIYSLSFYEDQLYWSDWGETAMNFIKKTNKFNSTVISNLTQLIHRPMELRVVSPLLQPSLDVNPCANLQCDGLCLLRPELTRSTAACACPDHHELSNDGRNCIPQCPLSTFQCSSQLQCIHFTQECDGYVDCLDGSDERDCIVVSLCNAPFMFDCGVSAGDHKRCIAPESVCDGETDCSHGGDEQVFNNCKNYTCLTGYTLCQNTTHSKCIEISKACTDETLICPDLRCDRKDCTRDQFSCGDGACIPYTFRCDGEAECSDKSDESKETCSSDCIEGYHKCSGTGQCIPNQWVCDAEEDCSDGADERPALCANNRCDANQFQCKNKKCIPRRWLCDYQVDCLPDGEDELQNCTRKCSESEWPCADGRMCIRRSNHCDGNPDCLDFSDESACGAPVTECADGWVLCSNSTPVCISKTWLCDSTPDCADLSDEIGCDRTCGHGMFQCDNSLCISASFKCDGQPDCADGSDESLCEENKCEPERYRCKNSICIPTPLLCDGKNDCGDHSDENNTLCSQKKLCGDGFKCFDDSCVTAAQVCDGKVDCPASFHLPVSFEHPLLGKLVTTVGSAQPTDEANHDFNCNRMRSCAVMRASSYFLRNTWMKLVMATKCGPIPKCEEKNVSLAANQTLELVKLTCIKGYELDVASKNNLCTMCQDKNECTLYSSCPHFCTNTPGSFNCSCLPGFTPSDTNINTITSSLWKHECRINRDEPDPLMLVADGNLLRSFDISPSTARSAPQFMTFVDSYSRIDSIVVDTPVDAPWTAYMLSYHTHEILKADISSLKHRNQTRKRRDDSTWTEPQSGIMSPARIITRNLVNPNSITFDWIRQNLYWTDSQLATITIMNVHNHMESDIVTISSMISAIQDRHFSPRAITIDPVTMLSIYWIDCCENPRIWKAALNGSDPAVLTSDVAWPTGIVCDVPSQRLYWTDAKQHTLHTVSTSGTNQRTIYSFRDQTIKPAMIDVFDKDLIITSADRRSVFVVSKFIGLEVTNTSTVSRTQELRWKVLASSGNGLFHVSDVAFVHPRKNILLPNGEPFTCACAADMIPTGYLRDDGEHICACVCHRNAVRIGPAECKTCPCLNGGECVSDSAQVLKCVCQIGYDGKFCELSKCPPNYCRNGGVCETLNLQPYCKCAPGFHGKRCEQSRCTLLSGCQKSGSCHLDDGGVPYCKCTSGSLGPNCTHEALHRCQNEGTNTPDGLCSCKSGYIGVDCQTCRIITQTDVVDHSCFDNGVCHLEGGIPKCTCDYPNLDPITQCRHSHCHPKSCSNGGTCMVENGSPKCLCPKYFTGDRCERRMLCITGYCQNGGSCIENDDSEAQPATCHCTRNYAGPTCSVFCGTKCPNGQECYLKSDRKTIACRCPPGRYGDKCQYYSQCTKYCFNGGTCQLCDFTVSDQNCSACCQCSCPPGVTGLRCETTTIKVDPSQSPNTNNYTRTLIAIIIPAVVLICIVAIIVFVIYRKRRRQQLFAHMMLREDATLEISNPMYMKADDDEAVGSDDDEHEVLDLYEESSSSHLTKPFSRKSKKKSRKHGEGSRLLVDDDFTETY